MKIFLSNLKRAAASITLAALTLSLMPLTAQAAVTSTFTFQGRLLAAVDTPAASTTYNARLSLWGDADFDAGTDVDGSGSLVGAGWSEVQTFTTDAQGFFILDVGSVSSLPSVFDAASHKYLQVEVKPTASADTAYFVLDNKVTDALVDRKDVGTTPFAFNAARLDGKKLGFTADDIPYLNSNGQLDEALIDDSWLPPVANETAMNALSGVSEGDVVYNLDNGRLYTYTGTVWVKGGQDLDTDLTALEARVTTAESDIDSNTAAITAETARATAAEAAIQADVDQNEADADAAIAAETARATAAEAALQADVDQNEADADAAIAAVQADVNQNESDADAAIAAETARATAAETALQADVDQNEADADAAIAAETARATAAEAALQADVDQNEADADAAFATLNGDVNTAGSVLRSVRDNAANATFASTSGLASTTVGTAIDEVNTALTTFTSGISWKSPVANFAALPSSGQAVGDTYYTIDTAEIYTWNGSAFVLTGAQTFVDATTGQKGIVQLAADGATTAGLVVQANDSRLAQVGTNTTNIATNAAAIAANAADITTLNSDVNTTGSVLKMINDNAETAVNTSNLAGATLRDALNTADSRLDTAEADILAEVARATAAEAALQADVDQNEADADAAIAALQADVDQNESDADAAIAAEIARATAAEAANSAALTAHKEFDKYDFDTFIVSFP